MASESLLSAMDDLRSLFSDASTKMEGVKKGRRPSVFAKFVPVPPTWTQKYFCRFVHIASSELVVKSKPEGLAAILLILIETRALVLDLYDMRKETGETSAKILEEFKMLTEIVDKLEGIVKNLSKTAKMTDSKTQMQENDLSAMVLAPQLMLDHRVFSKAGDPGGADHAELLKICPDMAPGTGKTVMVKCKEKGHDDLTCLLLTSNAVGTVIAEILDRTQLRHRYYAGLTSVFSFCRMLAWAEVRRTYGMDLVKSQDWVGTPSNCPGWGWEAARMVQGTSKHSSAFEEAVVTGRRRRSSSVSRDPSPNPAGKPPPESSRTFVPPPPHPDGSTRGPPEASRTGPPPGEPRGPPPPSSHPDPRGPPPLASFSSSASESRSRHSFSSERGPPPSPSASPAPAGPLALSPDRSTSSASYPDARGPPPPASFSSSPEALRALPDGTLRGPPPPASRGPPPPGRSAERGPPPPASRSPASRAAAPKTELYEEH